MKILALSDEVTPFIYGPGIRDHFADVDLVVGCGDLPANYLEYVMTMLNAPLVFVPGNHDPDTMGIQGGESIDGRIRTVMGLRLFGLGGSRRYKPLGQHQYTEGQMRWRVLSLWPRLWLSSRVSLRRPDLFVTHAPPRGVHDAPDHVHAGFSSFHWLMRTIRPRWMLHGHSHVARNLVTTETAVYGVRVVNVYPYRVIEVT